MRVGIDCRKIADFGIGTYIRGLLRELSSNYVAFGPKQIASMLPRNLEHIIVDAPNYSLRELVVIGRAADSARLDLFHAPHYVVPQMRTPCVVTIHDLIHLRRAPLQRFYAYSMMRRAIQRARAVMTVSETVKRQLERELNATNVIVTPNGIDDIFFSDRRPPTPDSPYFLFVGNDKPHKNVDRVVEACTRIGAPLTLVGAPFDRFRHRARCLGFVDQETLAALYRGAIALVIPSIEEGFGLPAAEAMASGTAVITSTAPALIELTGDAALHVEASDVDGLAEALRRVRDDRSLRATLIARGQARARSLTWSECARRTRDAYVAAIARA